VQASVAEQHEPTSGHGLGSQTVPTPLKTLGETHPLTVTAVQAPVVVLQQAPSSAVQGLVGAQATPTPWKRLVPVQLVESVTVHVPVVEQQAPVLGQGLARQVVPAPLKTLVPVQPFTVTLLQVPVVVQHAPSRAVQGLGVQLVAPSVKMLVPVQPPALRMVHTPVVLQHEPTFGQGLLGVQVVPAPEKVLVRVGQPLVVLVVHAPVVVLQQAPTSAVQGLVGVQATPWPRKVLVAVALQVAIETAVHVPVDEQQAPAVDGLTVRVNAPPAGVAPKLEMRMWDVPAGSATEPMKDARPLPGGVMPSQVSSSQPSCVNVVQSVVNTVMMVSWVEPHVVTSKLPAVAVVKVYHTPLFDEVWQVGAGPSLVLVAVALSPATGVLRVKGIGAVQRSLAGWAIAADPKHNAAAAAAPKGSKQDRFLRILNSSKKTQVKRQIARKPPTERRRPARATRSG